MEFARYVGVQILAYVLDMGGFIALTQLGAVPLWGNVFGKVLAGSFAFIAHRVFTFRGSIRHAASGQALRYWVLLAINIPLSSAVLWLLLLLRGSPVLSKFLADVLCLLLTYWLSRKFVFLADKTPDQNSDHEAGG